MVTHTTVDRLRGWSYTYLFLRTISVFKAGLWLKETQETIKFNYKKTEWGQAEKYYHQLEDSLKYIQCQDILLILIELINCSGTMLKNKFK